MLSVAWQGGNGHCKGAMPPPLSPRPCSITRWLLAQRGMDMATACSMARQQTNFIRAECHPHVFQAMLHHTVAHGAACNGDGRPLQGQETNSAELDAELLL